MLIGLPGAGKSSAGRSAAAQLGVAFVDLDERIAFEAGKTVPEILKELGEGAFRSLERDLMLNALAEPPQVIASGGGWAAQPGNLEAVAGRGIVIYLETTPEAAAERVGDAEDRPILHGHSVLEKQRELLGRREKYYRRANHTIKTDGMTDTLVGSAIAALARRHGGL
ncbi:MAG TPA: shikimate kinase [Gemmatimonadales bacterium]|nr:shikimate kinase [Gemmatimonadales bacterium]